MQEKRNQPQSRLLMELLALAAVGAVLWVIIAGMMGYSLGNPPTGFASCYHITRADWVIPMWKPASPSACQGIIR